MSLPYISQQITIYSGAIILFLGIIGNCLNILIFTSVRTYRQNSCVLYFLNSSIFNFIYISINLSTRILSIGFGIDPTRTSLIWCKIRSFCIPTFSQIIVCSTCLATISQFILTSRNARIRQLATTKSTYKIIFILNLFWILHGILPLVFFKIISDTKICMYTDAGYAIYAQFYLLGLNNGIPVFILLVFTYLTYRNLHQTTFLAEHGIDRQLVRMVFFQVALSLICLSPYGIMSAYSVATTSTVKNTNRILIENFIWTILTLWTYIFYAVN